MEHALSVFYDEFFNEDDEVSEDWMLKEEFGENTIVNFDNLENDPDHDEL